MFGYVRTDVPNMYIKDVVLYKAMYCGLCKSLGKTCGNLSRFTLNYDLTFLSVFCHNILGEDVKIEKKRCIAHWIIKRPVAKRDALTERIAALNLILAYHKLSDDISDEKKGRLKRAIFKKAYKKAVKAEPELNSIVKKHYESLSTYEKATGDSIDVAADFFGNMMVDTVGVLLNGRFNEDIKGLSYNLGKWIYLIDAVDDFDDDIKKGNYNVFVNAYKDIKDKKTFLTEKRADLQVIFGTILSDIADFSSRIEYKFNKDLTDNILLSGLNVQTKNVMENRKCRNSMKY